MATYSLEDLQVYQKSLAAADAISALTDKASFRRDPELRDQLRSASGRIPTHIGEGHGQKTDRHFAYFLYTARGSCKEIRGHLSVALGRGHVTKEEETSHSEIYDEIARMLTGLIRHLEDQDRKFRP